LKKQYADMRNRLPSCNIHVGDTVLLLNDAKGDKLSTHFNYQPHKIIARKGSMVTTTPGRHVITHNASRFKRIPKNYKQPVEQPYDDD